MRLRGGLGWWRGAQETAAPLAHWDAATTVFSVVATWMSARKVLEVWYVWIVVDFVYVGMFISAGLLPTAANYAVYLLMAVLGLNAWRASMLDAAGPESADLSNQ